MPFDYKALYDRLTRRYGAVTPEALESVLCPALIPIRTLDKTIFKVAGQSHYRGSFTIDIDPQCEALVAPGRTGKFVPVSYQRGGVWRELAKGRILAIDRSAAVAEGEVYTGAAGRKSELEKAFAVLTDQDFLEVDQYGASAKVLSALVEYSLVQVLTSAGYSVLRMPEDMARHIGGYAYYDFEVAKAGVTKKLEVKSLWGTNTKFARLIHSLGKGYPTSSCKFAARISLQ